MTLYQNAGVAVAFSPRLGALLAEVACRASYLASTISLIHVGACTPEKEKKLRAALLEAGLPEDTAIHWAEGAPDDAIIRTIQAQQIDLLLAGALEREKTLRYFLGSVAHNLAREAPCALVLFTEPAARPEPMRQVAVFTDYSEGSLIALVRAIRFAEQEGAERVFVVRVLSQYGDAMVLADGVRREQASVYQEVNLREERALLQDFVDAAGRIDLPVEPHCLAGHPGQAVAEFVRKQAVDLLVMPTGGGFGHFFERLFPSGMEWLLRQLPCNLWVVRERPPVA